LVEEAGNSPRVGETKRDLEQEEQPTGDWQRETAFKGTNIIGTKREVGRVRCQERDHLETFSTKREK